MTDCGRVNDGNEEEGDGHQSNQELAVTNLDQTTQLLFPTKTCSPTVPSEFCFSPALALCSLYNPVQIITAEPFGRGLRFFHRLDQTQSNRPGSRPWHRLGKGNHTRKHNP